MAMTNCPRCGKLFNQIRLPICPECEKNEEEEFKRVKEYVTDNPGANISEIVTETDVPLKRIQKFLRDGRLEVSKGLVGTLRCSVCGEPITKGRMCEACTLKTAEKIDDMFSEESRKPRGPVMHTRPANRQS